MPSNLASCSVTCSPACMYLAVHRSTQAISPTCRSLSCCRATHFLKHIVLILLNISVIISVSIFATASGAGPVLLEELMAVAVAAQSQTQKTGAEENPSV
eukprot:CAMPEP_0173350912 /NCGR_PEP_ID=MMETSP1144-20121109/15166_1 /TAXON_ID=483371 /ORGANISM="non described non described, Strain CCMP2298" /LENGTH=99 /DNA_ID=CAMNT_0014298949 /DNA_START=136 /DNA_END=431 /DNA_ORIENTATION=+